MNFYRKLTSETRPFHPTRTFDSKTLSSKKNLELNICVTSEFIVNFCFFFQIFYLLTLAKEKSFAFLLLSIQVQICFSANFCRFLNCLVQRQGWTGYFNLVRLTNLSANRRPFRPHSFKKFSLTSGFIQIVFCRFWWLRTHFFSCSKILVLKWKFIFPVKIFYSGFDSSLWCLIKNKDM